MESTTSQYDHTSQASHLRPKHSLDFKLSSFQLPSSNCMQWFRHCMVLVLCAVAVFIVLLCVWCVIMTDFEDFEDFGELQNMILKSELPLFFTDKSTHLMNHLTDSTLHLHQSCDRSISQATWIIKLHNQGHIKLYPRTLWQDMKKGCWVQDTIYSQNIFNLCNLPSGPGKIVFGRQCARLMYPPCVT